jgi:hypothetical protein
LGVVTTTNSLAVCAPKCPAKHLWQHGSREQSRIDDVVVTTASYTYSRVRSISIVSAVLQIVFIV